MILAGSAQNTAQLLSRAHYVSTSFSYDVCARSNGRKRIYAVFKDNKEYRKKIAV
jgi:hypothetical protein